MPGPAVHHIVARKVLSELKKAKALDNQTTNFYAAMDAGNYAPIYHLGAQGPDFLFFNMNDWPQGGTIKTVAQTYWEIQDFIGNLADKVKKMVPDRLWQAIDTLERLEEDAVERSATLSEIKQLSDDVKKNIDAMKSLIQTELEEYITSDL